MTGTPTFKDRALRAIAILGLIAILLLGAWGIIQIAFTLYGYLGTSTTETQTPAAQTQSIEQVTVSAPSAVTSGIPFTLSFTHTNASGNYAYQFSYSCASGLELQAPLPTGKTQTVACNTPFNYTNATSNVQLTATLTGSASVTTALTVAAENLATNAVTSTGSAQITVSPAASAPATTTTAPAKTSSSTYVAATRTATLYGASDLAVSIGAVSQNAGRYSVQFTIQNVGTNIAPAGWNFNASLPTSPAYTYTSQPQQALYPGDKIVYTLGFTMQNGYNYNSGYPYSYGYSTSYPANCGYSQNYTYNGVYTYPGTSYGCNTNANYTTYPSTSYPYNYNYGSNVMTVTTPNDTASVTLSSY